MAFIYKYGAHRNVLVADSIIYFLYIFTYRQINHRCFLEVQAQPSELRYPCAEATVAPQCRNAEQSRNAPVPASVPAQLLLIRMHIQGQQQIRVS
jgi:hypothetical protein